MIQFIGKISYPLLSKLTEVEFTPIITAEWRTGNKKLRNKTWTVIVWWEKNQQVLHSQGILQFASSVTTAYIKSTPLFWPEDKYANTCNQITLGEQGNKGLSSTSELMWILKGKRKAMSRKCEGNPLFLFLYRFKGYKGYRCLGSLNIQSFCT